MRLTNIFARSFSIALIVCLLSFTLTSDYFLADNDFVESCKKGEIDSIECEFDTYSGEAKELRLTLEFMYYGTEFIISFLSCIAFGLWGLVTDTRSKRSA